MSNSRVALTSATRSIKDDPFTANNMARKSATMAENRVFDTGVLKCTCCWSCL